MDKIKYLRIQEQGGSFYSQDIPIGVNAADVDMLNGNSLQNTIGNLDHTIDGSITQNLNNHQAAINQLDNKKLNKTDAVNYVHTEVTDWLDDNVTPVGSAVTVDNSLSISGAAADAKITGDEFTDLKDIFLADAKTGSHSIGVYTGLKFGNDDTTVSYGIGAIAVYKIRPYTHVHLTIHYSSSDNVTRNGIGLCNIATPESGTQIRRIGTTQAITEDSTIEFDNSNYNYCYVYFGLTNKVLNADKYIELVITEKIRFNGFIEAPQPVNYDLSTHTLTIPANSRISCGEITYAINNEIRISEITSGRIYYHRDTRAINTNSNNGIYLGVILSTSVTGTHSLPFLNCSNITLNGVSMALYADTTLSVSKAPADAQTVGAEISKLLSYKSSGIEIPKNTNLNDLVRGQYIISSADIARTLTNCPVEVGCRLVHFSSFGGQYQILYRISDSNVYNQWFMYIRKKTSSDSWIPWTKMQLPTYSEYYNKKLSILGDSISTYGGNVSISSGDDPRYADGTWTYAGNKIRYPQSNLLTDVEKTYWKIIMNYTGMIYGVNDSIAGSRCSWNGITENDSEGANKHAACMTRIGHLGENGTPDVILVNIGTNDQGNNVDIGPETDTEKLPSWYDYYASPESYTQEQIEALPVKTFKDAYRTMLVRIMWMYPSAKIICMTVNFRKNTRLDKTDIYNEAIKDVCDMLGVPVIDTRHSGISVFELPTCYGDSTHYNAKGMQLLADTVLKAFMYYV